MNPNNAVVLTSGGLDSATCLAIASKQHSTCHCLSFDYGQKNRAEIHSAKKLAKQFGATYHSMPLSLDSFGGSALTDQAIDIPDYKGDQAIPPTYVPARNTIFLSVALGLAEIMQAQHIYTGICAIDYSGYIDCRPEYLAAFTRMAQLATKAGVEGQTLKIHAPLLYLSKSETIQLGLSLGVDYADTVTCYRADPNGLACGTCDSCTLRKLGFQAANVADPTRYQNAG